MANYTNLTSLEGLAVGDVITYDTTTAIDFKGYKVKVELHGKNGKKPPKNQAIGGLVVATIDSSKLPEKILTAVYGTSTQLGRCDICYGDTDNLYSRILTVGFASNYTNVNATQSYGYNGGGITGLPETASRGTGVGGTQTAGGAGGESMLGGTEQSGSFGRGGTGSTTLGAGGYGWYGGGGGNTYSAARSGGGGSSFIIGNTTDVYPDNYLGNDVSLRNTIISAIEDASTTTGGATLSSEDNPYIMLVILETPSQASSSSELQYFNGTEFVPTTINYYNGSEFVVCDGYYYDGTEFKKI